MLAYELDLISKSVKNRVRKYIFSFHLLIVFALIITSYVDFKPKKKKIKFVAQIIELPNQPKTVNTEKVKNVKKSEVVKDKRQPKAKPRIKPKTKPNIKKKPTKRVKKSNWKPLSSDFIKVNKVTRKNIVKPKISKVSLSKVQVKISSKLDIKQKTSASPNAKATFYDKVWTILYQNWEPPVSAKLLSYTPEVTINIILNSAGKVTSWRITTPSTISAVNSSIGKMMQFVKQLPPPPVGIKNVEVTLKVK